MKHLFAILFLIPLAAFAQQHGGGMAPDPIEGHGTWVTKAPMLSSRSEVAVAETNIIYEIDDKDAVVTIVKM